MRKKLIIITILILVYFETNAQFAFYVRADINFNIVNLTERITTKSLKVEGIPSVSFGGVFVYTISPIIQMDAAILFDLTRYKFSNYDFEVIPSNNITNSNLINRILRGSASDVL